MTIPRAVPMLAVPAVLVMVPLAALGFLGQIFVEWQGGFISDFPVTGWLQDVLGPSALEGLLLGAAYGAYRIYRTKKAKSSLESDDDGSARCWIHRYRATTTIVAVFLVAFTVWRVWWIFFSGFYIGDFAAIVEKMNNASEVSVYRGLPAKYEDTYQTEIKKANVERHGFRFYAEERKLSDPEAHEIKSILSSRYLFTSLPVFRMCGGFHPDFSIMFHDSNGDYEIQLCLGCGEIRSYGPRNAVELAMHYGGKMELEKFESELFRGANLQESR